MASTERPPISLEPNARTGPRRAHDEAVIDPASPGSPELIHVWNRCHACNAAPIAGPRFQCETCPDGPDNDLCERCHSAYALGNVQHPMPGSFVAFGGGHLGERHRFTRVIGASRLACSRWAAVPDATGNAPTIPDRFVVRPEFCTGRESFIGSYAFVTAGPPVLLLTCLHVMSSVMQAKGIDASASNDSYSGRELPGVVTSVNLYDVFASNWMVAGLGRAASMLTLPETRTKDAEPYSQRDLAAFVVDSAARVCPLRLADRVPDLGAPIWLVAKPDGGSKERTVAAVVVEHTERTFIFRYVDGGKAIPRFTSGAPLLNGAGEVVGINVGFGTLDGQRFGHASHVTSIRRHLNLQ
jgi:hypothetical protein